MPTKTELSVLGYANNELPIFEEKGGKNYVTYGADDHYGEYLRDLFLTSSTHNAIVNGVADMIHGEGLDASDRDENDGKREAWLRYNELMDACDSDLLRKMALDIKLYGMTYVNTIWNRGRTRIKMMKHLPVHQMRSGLVDSEGRVPLFYHKTDWSKRNQPMTAIKAFDLEDRTEASQVLLIKRYTPAYHYYALPDYVGSTNYIELDREIGQFHVNNIQNGLFPSMLLSFKNGVPTDEERRQIERKVLDKFSGADNAGRILITFNDGDETAPDFTTINSNDADGMFQYLSGEVAVKILTGHRVTSPLLFGIRGDGSGFGNNADELRDSYSLFHNTVVEPFQSILIDGLQPVFDTNEIDLDFSFIPLKPADFLGISIDSEVDTGEVERSYTGIQISSALEIVAKVTTKELSQEQGIALLITMLGFTEDAARAMFADEQEMQQAFSRDETPGSVADELIAMGEDEDDDYELIDAREVDYDLEEQYDAAWAFARAIIPEGSRPTAGKSEQDTPLIKVRYKYAPEDVQDNTREFCRKMIQAGRVYRKEDIMAASKRAVNPGWGPRGASTYDIWLYKGGGYCRHFWKRHTYLRKDNKQISVKQAERIIREAGPQEPRMAKNDPRVARRPRDMDNAGFLPSNPKPPLN